MKAKEYYEQYKNILNVKTEEELNKKTSEILVDFCEEAKKIIIARRVGSSDGLIAVLKEQNQKWNAVCNLFLKEPFGLSPLKPDGFIIYWALAFPQFNIKLHQGRGSGKTLLDDFIKEVSNE